MDIVTTSKSKITWSSSRAAEDNVNMVATQKSSWRNRLRHVWPGHNNENDHYFLLHSLQRKLIETCSQWTSKDILMDIVTTSKSKITWSSSRAAEDNVNMVATQKSSWRNRLRHVWPGHNNENDHYFLLHSLQRKLIETETWSCFCGLARLFQFHL